MMQIHLNPFAGEALHSYLLRLAQGYGLQNSKQLLKAVSLKPRLAYDAQQLGLFAEEFRLSVDVLVAMNPTPESSTPILNLKHQRSAGSPICPCCVREAPYIRALWDHELITACPLHGVLLMDVCPGCSEPITRERESITHCQHCNRSFSETVAESAESYDLALSALIAGAAHPARALLPMALQSGSPPPDIAAFLAYLATHIQPANSIPVRAGKEPRPKTIQESRGVLRRAWSALTPWPTGVEAFIEARIREGEGRSVHQRVGRWLAIFQRQFDPKVYGFFAEVVERVLHERFDGSFALRHRGMLLRSENADALQWFSAAEAARLLGIAPDILTNLVVKQKVPGRVHQEGSNRFVAIHRETIDQIKEHRGGYLSATDARRRLNISKTCFERFTQAGGLRRYKRDERPLLVAGEFRVEDVDKVINQLVGRVRKKPRPSRLIGLEDISAKHGISNAKIISVLQDILHGTICPVAHVTELSGLAGLQFDKADIETCIRDSDPDASFSVDDLAKVSGWKAGVIKKWIQGGFLRAVEERHGKAKRDVVQLSALIKFLLTYTPTAELSSQLNTKTQYLIQSWRPAQIEILTPPQDTSGGQRGLLVRNADLARAAQLRKPTIRELAEQLGACA
ncbi:TniQ family protein [Metapseudomonas boanensis]|uniref:TniQ family protein n=1 Tax=Metapseudomonas boanensis TaxID=2822138 RepID=A0ABS5XJU5_9GAMM|nr:TniQ family protein [Pseudomonas boanensis]MBT8767330.1 TniQ family protein [Pseudomonas boanensis]